MIDHQIITIGLEDNNAHVALTANSEAEGRKQINALHLTPEMNAAKMILAFNSKSSLDINEIMEELRRHNEALNNGDLTVAESMLLNQAQSLQAMFVHYAQKAQQEDCLAKSQILMTLAFKAQAQSRAALQALADVKFPKQATFIRQANIANQQQVNNAAPENNSFARAEKNQESNQSNELLERQYGKRVDTGAARTTSNIDQDLETMGALNRSKDNGR